MLITPGCGPGESGTVVAIKGGNSACLLVLQTRQQHKEINANY